MTGKKEKKMDLAETIEDAIAENPALIRTADKLLQNPAIQKVIDKVFFKTSLKYGLLMACLTAGVFSIVNGLIVGLDLGWMGWVGFGTTLASGGGIYTIKQLMSNESKADKKSSN